jgi:hypothetical protein
MVGMVFQWSGLTDQLSEIFFGSGACGVLLLAVLTFMNVAANLNIVSKSQASKATGQPIEEAKPGSFFKTISVAAVLIGIVVGSLWYAEWRLYKTRENESFTKIESIADTELAKEAISLIQSNATIDELRKIREALAGNIQSDDRLSLIFPKKVKNVDIYCELTAWSYGCKQSSDKISDADLTKFVPKAQESKKFAQMISGNIASFSVPNGNDLRTFRLVKTDKGTIILLLDTSRRSDYSRGSF